MMSQVDIRTKVRKGDTAYTTSYSVYPENIPVGTVVAIDTYKVNNSLNLKLRLSNNFRNLKYVYVVKDNLGTERKDLEKAAAAKEKAAMDAVHKN
ncbi:rod shape-determining protein MreC [compost metagenome]